MRQLAMWISGKKVFKEKSQCQGTEVGVSLVCSKNSKKTPGSMNVVGAER